MANERSEIPEGIDPDKSPFELQAIVISDTPRSYESGASLNGGEKLYVMLLKPRYD